MISLSPLPLRAARNLTARSIPRLWSASSVPSAWLHHGIKARMHPDASTSLRAKAASLVSGSLAWVSVRRMSPEGRAAPSCDTRNVAQDPRNRTPAHSVQAEVLRATELDRLRALVEGDLDRARELHAEDFQLITPSGQELSRDEYLAGVASGDLNYLAWDAGPIAVRLYAENTVAVIRYRSELEMMSNGHHVPRQPYWHTDLYEQGDGRWQVIWSHATKIA